MPSQRRLALVAAALAVACVPTDPAGSATEGTGGASESTTAASSLSGSTTGGGSTSGGPETGGTAGDPTTMTGTTATTSGEPTTSGGPTSGGPDGCGDGEAAAGELCFDLVAVDQLWLDTLRVVDFDGDGHLDLVGVASMPCPERVDRPLAAAGAGGAALPGAPREGASSLFVYVALGDGAGAFTLATGLNPDFNGSGDLAVGDFNGDGDLDVALPGQDGEGEVLLVFAGDGAGGLAAPSAQPLPFFPVGIEAGDLDGDGDGDLVLGGLGGARILLGDGLGGFTVAPASEAPADLERAPHLHDLDGDGDLDLLVVHGAPMSALATHLGVGDGTFKAGQIIPFDGEIEDIEVVAPAIGERAALLVGSYVTMVGRRVDALEVAPAGTLGAPALVSDADASDLAVGAFDGGARPDALLFGAAGALALLGQEPWPPAPIELLAGPLYPASRPGVGDLNEDGIDDVVLPGQVRLLLSDP